MHARSKIVLGAGLLLALAAGAHAFWAASLSRAFDARVARYRAEGRPVAWSEIAGPSSPDAENVAGPLRRARTLVDALGEERTAFMSRYYDGAMPTDDEERADLRTGLDATAPSLALVDGALRLPRFAPFLGATPFVPERHAWIDDAWKADYLLVIRGRSDPATAPATVDALLTIADRWQARTHSEMQMRRNLRRSALRMIRTMVESGQPFSEGDARRWTQFLEAAEEKERAALEASLEADRVEILECVAAYRRGEDPVAALWERPPKGGIGGWLRGLLGRASPYAGWTGQVRLHREAREALDEIEALRTRARDDAALRADPAIWTRRRLAPDDVKLASFLFVNEQDVMFPNLLHELARLRLARVAIRLRRLHQEGKPFPARLDDLGDLVGARTLEDPLTGEPFNLETLADGVFVKSRIAERAPAARPDWLDATWTPEHLESGLANEYLAWEIR